MGNYTWRIMTTKLNQILLSKKNHFASVSSQDYQSETDFLNHVAEILNNGVDIIELRENNLPTNMIMQIGKKMRDLTAVFNALLIIYDRIDIAKLIHADGVSLDENTISVTDARKLLEDNFLLGYKTNVSKAANIAEQNGADFIITTQHFELLNVKQFHA